jgi:hypothetical protein
MTEKIPSIEELIKSDDAEVANKAGLVQNILDSYKNNEITADECKELLEDTVRLGDIKEQANATTAMSYLFLAVSAISIAL